MNKNDAEAVIRDAVEYANNEIRKTKKRYHIATLAVIAVIVLGIVIFGLIYTRPRTIEARYPYLDLSKCTGIRGYYYIYGEDDPFYDIQCDIKSTDSGFNELLDMVRSAEFKTKLNNILPPSTGYHSNEEGDFRWDIVLVFDDGIELPDGSACRGDLVQINNFFGDLTFSFDGDFIRCSVKDQKQWARTVLDIISQYAVK